MNRDKKRLLSRICARLVKSLIFKGKKRSLENMFDDSRLTGVYEAEQLVHACAGS